MGRRVKLFLNVKTVSECNQWEHWAPRSRRVKQHREMARKECSTAERDFGRAMKLPVSVKLTRVGPRKLDGDNLQSSCKALRDGIADWLGVDDGDDSKVSWEYAQRVGKPAGVEVEVIQWYD